MKNPDDHDLVDEITKELKGSVGENVGVQKYYEVQESTEDVIGILDIIFSATIAIMMFLCFFSLTASMSANLYDQSKEVGILRAIGVTKGRIRILFFYEALILVFASCILGIFIGMIVGYTMVLQQNLFLQTADVYFFPWQQTLEILALSIVCSFLATFGPASQLVANQIASLFRII